MPKIKLEHGKANINDLPTDEIPMKVLAEITGQITGRNHGHIQELYEGATRNGEAIRQDEERERSGLYYYKNNPYETDMRRIGFEKGFQRLGGKTQTVSLPEDPHTATRLKHGLEVGDMAYSAARSLGLNPDLAVAIGRDHDIGHTPLGHFGEKLVSHAVVHYGVINNRKDIWKALGIFKHAVQGVHSVDRVLQRRGSHTAGLNLTDQTRHGIVSHDGEKFTGKSKWKSVSRTRLNQDIKNYIKKLTEVSGKVGFKGDPNSWEDVEEFMKKVGNKLHEEKVEIKPATPEASLVYMMDSLCYCADDFDDYVRMRAKEGKPTNLPPEISEVLGTNGGDMFHRLITDLVIHSYKNLHMDGKKEITYSKRVAEALNLLKSFLYKNFYEANNQKIFVDNGNGNPRDRMIYLFDRYAKAMEDQQLHWGSPIVKDFQENRNMGDYYRKMWHIEDSRIKIYQLVTDYIAGFTDEYFFKQSEGFSK